MKIIIETIPHVLQRYDTVGDWQWTSPDVLVISVSETGDWRANMGIAYHELFEALACKHAGISQDAVDAFDMAWQEHDGLQEPGDDPHAPYFTQHQMALVPEQCLLAMLGLGQAKYLRLLGRLSVPAGHG